MLLERTVRTGEAPGQGIIGVVRHIELDESLFPGADPIKTRSQVLVGLQELVQRQKCIALLTETMPARGILRWPFSRFRSRFGFGFRRVGETENSLTHTISTYVSSWGSLQKLRSPLKTARKQPM